METLSTSVPSLKLHTFSNSTTLRELSLFKSSNPTNLLPPHTHLHKHNPNPISNKPKNKPYFPSPLHSKTPPSSHTPLHTKPSTGYAAALIDVARCNKAHELVVKDVARLSRMLRSKDLRGLLVDKGVSEETKARVVKEVVEKGRFRKEVEMVVKMVIEKKNGVRMVSEVVDEFERISDEMNGIQVVYVSSAKKLEQDQLFGIVEKVQKINGGMKVKVKNLIQERTPSFSFAS